MGPPSSAAHILVDQVRDHCGVLHLLSYWLSHVSNILVSCVATSSTIDRALIPQSSLRVYAQSSFLDEQRVRQYTKALEEGIVDLQSQRTPSL